LTNELKLEAKHTIDTTRFVDEDEIDTRYWEKPYYLVPDGDEATWLRYQAQKLARVQQPATQSQQSLTDTLWCHAQRLSVWIR
jgi:non-homologous end joining protein Ku